MSNVSSSNGLEKYPKLRFKGFSEPWFEIQIGNIFDVTRGYVLASNLTKEAPTIEYQYPVYSSQTKNNGLMGYYSDFLYENAITWTTDGANAGTVNFREGRFYCTNVCGVLLNNEGYANRCISEILGSVSKKYVSYVGNPKLMNNVMSEIRIIIPTVEEQKKISEFIATLDCKIAKQMQLIENLKKYKRGLLKTVFRQESAFSGYDKWEIKAFSTIATLRKEKYAPTISDNRKCIELEHIEPQTGRLLGCCESSLQNSIKSVFKKGDVLFGKLRPYLQKYVLPNFDGVCSSEIWVLVPLVDIDSTFLYYLIQSEEFISSANISSGTKMPRAEWSKVSSDTFCIPSIEEQKKIAKVFFNFDKKIAYALEQLDALALLKRSFLQKMFI